MTEENKKGFEFIALWKGKPVTEMTKEELIEALNWCGKEIERLYKQNEHDREYVFETFIRK